jgi:hypothetical protein
MKPGSARKRQTNVQFVKALMEESRHGALAQLFVIDALWKWSLRIKEMSDEELCEAFKDHGLVSGDAWQAVAREINAKLEARLESA